MATNQNNHNNSINISKTINHKPKSLATQPQPLKNPLVTTLKNGIDISSLNIRNTPNKK